MRSSILSILEDGEVRNAAYWLDDGLIFGEMQKLDMTPELAEAAAPSLMDCKGGVAIKRQLADYFCNKEWRLQVVVKTFVGRNELKENQLRLKAMLDRYVNRHVDVIECFRNQTDDFEWGQGGKHNEAACSDRKRSVL
jgi:hypothetical protein